MQTEYTFTQSSYLELQKRRLLFYGILGLVGLIGVIVFIILYVNFDYNKYLVLMFIPSLVFAGFGLLYFFFILIMVLRLKNVEVRFVYTFKKESMKVKSYDGNKVTSDNEVYYNFLTKYKETKKNFFLYLANRKVLAFDINDPNLEEIKKIIKIEEIPAKRI